MPPPGKVSVGSVPSHGGEYDTVRPDSLLDDEPDVPLKVSPYAARVLMKVLYAARDARFDLLRAVCALAQQVTKWARECDLTLCRFMCYIQGPYTSV